MISKCNRNLFNLLKNHHFFIPTEFKIIEVVYLTIDGSLIAPEIF